MGTTNTGNQLLSFAYGQAAKSIEFNRLNFKLHIPGIYQGGELSKLSATEAQIAIGIYFFYNTNSYIGVRVQTLDPIIITVDEAKPYITAKMEWLNQFANYADFEVKAFADIESDDVILGKCLFDTGDLRTTFDLTRRFDVRDSKNQGTLPFKVYSTEPEANTVTVNSGKYRAYDETFNFSTHRTSPVVPDTIDGRIDLVYLDKNGDINILEGVDEAIPSTPAYQGKLVLAEIRRGAGRTTISGDEIANVTSDKEYTTLDGITVENGEITIPNLDQDKLLFLNSTYKVASVSNLDTWIKGTANQIIVSPNIVDGSVTLSFASSIAVDEITELSLDNGVDIEQVNLKDGIIKLNNITTASRLLSVNSDKEITNTDLVFWIQGVGSQITVIDDGNGGITIGLPENLILTGLTADTVSTDVLQETTPGNGITIPSDVTIGGDLTVNGTTTTINTEDLDVIDNMITVNKGEAGAGVTKGYAGLKVDRGSLNDYALTFDEVRDVFAVGELLDEGIPAVAEESLITVLANTSESLNGLYFTLDSPTLEYYVWYSTGGVGVDPAVVGKTGINVDLPLGDSTDIEVAGLTELALDATGVFTATQGTTPDDNQVSVLNVVPGASNNSTGGDSGFTVSTVTNGVDYIPPTANVAGLQVLATREDSPVPNGVAYWDSVNKKFITLAGLVYDNGLVSPTGITVGDSTKTVAGTIRWNAVEGQFEGYDGFIWGAIGGGGAGTLTTYTTGEAVLIGQPACIKSDGLAYIASKNDETLINVIGFFTESVGVGIETDIQKIGTLEGIDNSVIPASSYTLPVASRLFDFNDGTYEDQNNIDPWNSKSQIELANTNPIISGNYLRETPGASTGGYILKSSYNSVIGLDKDFAFTSMVRMTPGAENSQRSIFQIVDGGNFAMRIYAENFDGAISLWPDIRNSGVTNYLIWNSPADIVYSSTTETLYFISFSYSNTLQKLIVRINGSYKEYNFADLSTFVADKGSFTTDTVYFYTHNLVANSTLPYMEFDNLTIHEGSARTLLELEEEYQSYFPSLTTGLDIFLGNSGTLIQDQDAIAYNEYRVPLGYAKTASAIEIQMNEPVLLGVSAQFYASIPIGAIIPITTEEIPEGFMKPDGSAISRSYYFELNDKYSAIGYPYGDGDGSTTFNLPTYEDSTLLVKVRSISSSGVPGISTPTRMTYVSVDTTLISGEKYVVQECVNLTLPTLVTLGDAIEIVAESPCKVLQPSSNNVITFQREGTQTTKGTAGYLAIKAGQRIVLTYDGSGYYYTESTSPTLIGSVTGAVGGYSVAWSPCGNYLAVGTSTASPYVQWFKRTGDTLTLIGGLPSVVAEGRNVTWSPDGNYLVVGNTSVSPYVQWWKRTGDTMNYIGGLTGVAANGTATAWSPDSIYLAVATVSVSPYLQWYKRTGDTLALIGAVPGAVINSLTVAWSPCGTYLAVGLTTFTPYVHWFKRAGDTLTLIGGLTGAVAAAYSVAWSPCGNYLAVGTSTVTPHLQWYKRTGDTMVLLESPSGVTANGFAVAWSPCGGYLVVGSSTLSPYSQWFKRNGDTLTLIGSLTSASATGRAVSWSPNGKYIALGSAFVSPFVQWFRAKDLATEKFSVRAIEALPVDIPYIFK